MNLTKSSLSKVAVLVAIGAAVLLAGPRPASADTIDIFNVSGTFVNSTTLSGTITIDVTTGNVTSESLNYLGKTYAVLLVQDAFFGGTNSGHTPKPVGYESHVGITSSQLPRIDLLFQGTSGIASLVGYTGGALCSVVADCGPDQQGTYWVSDYRAPDGSIPFLNSGSLKLAKSYSTVPEPSSLALLGLGMLALLGLTLKKSL